MEGDGEKNGTVRGAKGEQGFGEMSRKVMDRSKAGWNT